METMKDEVVTCLPDAWMETYIPTVTSWSPNFVNSILDSLRTRKILDNEGWAPILNAIRDGDDEDATFSRLKDISKAIADTVIYDFQYLENQRLWTIAACSHEKIQFEDPEYLFAPNSQAFRRGDEVPFRKILRRQPHKSIRLTDQCLQTDRYECQHPSDETSHVAVIGEFKLENTSRDRKHVNVAFLTNKCPLDQCN